MKSCDQLENYTFDQQSDTLDVYRSDFFFLASEIEKCEGGFNACLCRLEGALEPAGDVPAEPQRRSRAHLWTHSALFRMRRGAAGGQVAFSTSCLVLPVKMSKSKEKRRQQSEL